METVKNYLAPTSADQLWSGDSDDMIALHDDYGRVTRVSESVHGLLGLSPDDLLGRPLTDILVPGDRAQVLSLLSRASATGEKGRAECRLLKADGSIAWTEVTVSTDPKGRIRTITRDIAARHQRDRHEQAARQRAEAEVENRTNYLADLSHEIRTPLSALIGFADMMRSETFGPVGHEKYGEYAELIHKSGQHLLSLVSDLLDIAKIEAGKFQLHKEATDLLELIRDCVEISRLGAEEAGLYLQADLGQDLPEMLVDPKAIRQILLNLLSNATKFTKEGGINVRLRADAGNIWISVSDTGIGMNKDNLARIGARFEQAHNEGVRGAAGTGLGLALTNALVQLHRGDLRLASEEGEGTKVVVCIPRIDAVTEDTDNAETIATSPARSMDDEAAFYTLTDMLTNALSTQRKAS